MKSKFDVFNTFKKLKAMVEIESRLNLKCIRSNNGGECIDGGLKNIVLLMVPRWRRPF
jgi:hypothetical protein